MQRIIHIIFILLISATMPLFSCFDRLLSRINRFLPADSSYVDKNVLARHSYKCPAHMHQIYATRRTSVGQWEILCEKITQLGTKESNYNTIYHPNPNTVNSVISGAHARKVWRQLHRDYSKRSHKNH